jgi:hypothetical protein
MLALVVVLVASFVVRSVSLAAQELPLVPPPLVAAVLTHVLTAVNLSAEQQLAIAPIIAAHKDAVETARASGDLVTLRQEIREVYQQIVQLLTPEQLKAAKTAIRETLAKRTSASQ